MTNNQTEEINDLKVEAEDIKKQSKAARAEITRLFFL